MSIRFCADCMSAVGLEAANSRLALPTCASNRFVSCDGPEHLGALITVDPAGRMVAKTSTPSVVSTWKDVRPGHSLTRV